MLIDIFTGRGYLKGQGVLIPATPSPEHSNQSGQENREEDEIDFASICADLDLSSVNIQTSLRLGKKWITKQDL